MGVGLRRCLARRAASCRLFQIPGCRLRRSGAAGVLCRPGGGRKAVAGLHILAVRPPRSILPHPVSWWRWPPPMRSSPVGGGAAWCIHRYACRISDALAPLYHPSDIPATRRGLDVLPLAPPRPAPSPLLKPPLALHTKVSHSCRPQPRLGAVQCPVMVLIFEN